MRNVRKTLGSAEESFTLRLDAFDLFPGKVVAVTGRSGSGKSTMLDLMSLITRPDAADRFTLRQGSTTVDIAALWAQGDDGPLSDLRRANMGYVLQSGGLCSFLSVRENLLLPLRMAGLPARADVAQRMLETFGMGGKGGRDVRSLSGGERQRVAILRALAHRPAIVFADEPTAALDFDTAQVVLGAFASLARDAGAAVVFVTHDPDLIGPFTDYRVLLQSLESEAGHHVYGAVSEPAERVA